MGKENSSAAANVGENKNKRKPFYRKKGNGGGDNSNAAVTTKKIKEMKFYLHDSAARKSSESFGKIKESIILRIQKSFEEHIFLTESIISKTKKVFPSQKGVRVPLQSQQRMPTKGLWRTRRSWKNIELIMQYFAKMRKI